MKTIKALICLAVLLLWVPLLVVLLVVVVLLVALDALMSKINEEIDALLEQGTNDE